MSRMQHATITPLRLQTTSSPRLAPSAYVLQAADYRHSCPCICTRLGASAAMARPTTAALNPGLSTKLWIC